MSTNFTKNKQWIYSFSSEWRTLLDRDKINIALEEMQESTLSGRNPVYFITLNTKKCVLRFFHHGGILRNLFKDIFWEKKVRAFEELKLLEYFLQKGLNVVRPVLAGRSSGDFYRQFIVTEYEDSAFDLNDLEKMDHDFLHRLFNTLDLFFDNGMYHPDLNIKNIMVTEGGDRIILLDFDKAVTLNNSVPVSDRKSMLKRMFRSFHKMGKMSVFEDFNFKKSSDYVEQSYHSYSKKSFFRSLLWIFNQK